MMGIVLLLLIVWVVLGVIGLVVKGLLWLFIVGLILFLATAAWGWMKRQT